MREALFDKSAEYEAMLARGLRLTGEDRHYFQTGRLDDLVGTLPRGFKPRHVLDFGCGLGDATSELALRFPNAEVLGVDTATGMIEEASRRNNETRTRFAVLGQECGETKYDLCYCNGVFHHIKPAERPAALQWIGAKLRPGGFLAVFENNPWNPGTRLVMSRIAFDRDAKTLSPRSYCRVLRQAGFAPSRLRFLFFFPRPLRFLRPLESRLRGVPLGAQYWALACAA